MRTNKNRYHGHSARKNSKNPTNTSHKRWKGLSGALLGGVLAVLVTGIGIFLGALLFSANILTGTPGQFQIVSFFIQILSLGIGAIWVVSQNKGRGKLWALGMVGLYYMILWIIQFLTKILS